MTGRAAALAAVAFLAGCGSAAAPRLTVTPSTALVDAPVRILVSGLRAHERLTVRASTVDCTQRRFAAHRVFFADSHGNVRVPRSLLASMKPPGDPSSGYRDCVPFGGERVAIDAEVRGRRAAARFDWRLQSPSARPRELRPRRDALYADFFPAEGGPRRPAVLLFGGSEGGLATYDEARLLAARGFPTLALAYFDEPGLPADLFRIPLDYFARAARRLADLSGRRRVVVYGISRGSEAALLLGVHFPALVRGVVALVPSNVVVCAAPDCGGAAWTFRGNLVPFQAEYGPDGPAAIPVERIRVPVLLDCGGVDDLWPSCPMARAIVHRRGALPTELLAYRDGGHGVGDLVPYVPQSYPLLEGRTEESNARARADGWPKLLRFLRNLAD